MHSSFTICLKEIFVYVSRFEFFFISEHTGFLVKMTNFLVSCKICHFNFVNHLIIYNNYLINYITNKFHLPIINTYILFNF